MLKVNSDRKVRGCRFIPSLTFSAHPMQGMNLFFFSCIVTGKNLFPIM